MKLKTKRNIFQKKHSFVLVVTFITLVVGCQTNDILNSEDVQNVNAESASASYINETGDMAVSALSGIDTSLYKGSGITGLTINGLSSQDYRLNGATVTLTTSGNTNSPAGIVTIDFGTGITDANQVTRKGTIRITYSGNRWIPGSTINVRLVNYYRNYDFIQSNLTLIPAVSTDTLHVIFSSVIAMDSGTVIFGDGKSITRSQNFTRQWVRSIASPSNNQWITFVGGTAKGISKQGTTYSLQVTKNLIEKVTCLTEKVFIPVQGTKLITAGNTYLVDFGNGSCNKNSISVTLKGKVEHITVTSEGN